MELDPIEPNERILETEKMQNLARKLQDEGIPVPVCGKWREIG